MSNNAVVRAWWVDSCSIGGWRAPPKIEEVEGVYICSVGWLVDENEEFVILSTSRSETGDILDPITIPKCAIVHMEHLKGV